MLLQRGVLGCKWSPSFQGPKCLVVTEEARRKAEDEASHLAIERVSLLLELRTCKDKVSAIREEALKEKKALEKAYEEGFDVISNYGYGCCAFTHACTLVVGNYDQLHADWNSKQYFDTNMTCLI